MSDKVNKSFQTKTKLMDFFLILVQPKYKFGNLLKRSCYLVNNIYKLYK